MNCKVKENVWLLHVLKRCGWCLLSRVLFGQSYTWYLCHLQNSFLRCPSAYHWALLVWRSSSVSWFVIVLRQNKINNYFMVCWYHFSKMYGRPMCITKYNMLITKDLNLQKSRPPCMTCHSFLLNETKLEGQQNPNNQD